VTVVDFAIMTGVPVAVGFLLLVLTLHGREAAALAALWLIAVFALAWRTGG
jgi:hypothetical protein